MHPRLFFFLALILLFCVPASGILLAPLSDEQLVKAVELLKAQDYAGALEMAVKSPPKGIGVFVAGYAAYRNGSYDRAAGLLEQSVTAYPLLGDYALYYQADSLSRTGQHDQALATARRVLKEYPGSSLSRQLLQMEADILFARQDWPSALAAYLGFVEKYASGTDAVQALFRVAACREKLNEKNAAASLYRSIWLNSPASSLAPQAAEKLRLLADAGVPAPPFTREELLHRATTLAELRQYDAALAAFDAIPPGTSDDDLSARILLKKGQTLFKVRRYRDADRIFSRLMKSGQGRSRDEIIYWQSRALDKLDRDNEAVQTFLQLTESFPRSPLADDALMQAALILKEHGDTAQATALLERLLSSYPASEYKQRALWETGWLRYLKRDFPSAAERFKTLAELPEMREKALYWLGRSYEGSGNQEYAGAVFAMLSREFPAGFYTVRYVKGAESRDSAVSPPDFIQTVPVPAGFGKIKALITLGMYTEARKELAVERKQPGGQQGVAALARLYLEMEDYKSPIGLVKPEKLSAVTADNLLLWNLSYPLPYRKSVGEQAGSNGIPESLIYAVIRAESSFSPSIVSPAGAVGLMQLMPATAKQIAGGKGEFSSAALTKPEFNILCGSRHLRDLSKLHDNSLVLTVAAYNAGSGSVNRWRKKFGSLREDEFIENIPYSETRDYIKKVLLNADFYHRIYNLKPAVLAAPRDLPRKTPSAPASDGGVAEHFANRSTTSPSGRL